MLRSIACGCAALTILAASGCAGQGGRVYAASPGPVRNSIHSARVRPDHGPAGSLQLLWRYRLPAAPKSRPGLGGLVCVDLNSSGRPQIIARGGDGAVVVDSGGRRLGRIALGEDMQALAACRTPAGPLIIGFDVWGDAVEARDKNGGRVWRYAVSDDAVDWACPVDIGATEGDAVAIGYNGDAGVRLVSATGKLIWQAKGPGDVWSVAAAHVGPGRPSAILAPQDDGLWVLDSHGRKQRVLGPGTLPGAAFGADLDGDGIDEMMGLGTYQVSGQYLWVYGADGNLRWRRQVRTPYAYLSAPITAGGFLPGGRQVAVGVTDGTIVLFGADGAPRSYLKVSPDLRAVATLPRAPKSPDALMTLTSGGIACYAWNPGLESVVPKRLYIAPSPPREPPLIQAVLKNDPVSVNALLAKGADPNTRNSQGSPALNVAANRGFAGIVKALLDHHANVNIRSRSATTPLIEAAGSGHPDVAGILLAHGADPNAPDTAQTMARGTTPLMMAAMIGDAATAKMLLDAGARVNASTDQSGTALHWAAMTRHARAAELLIARGAKVDARTWMAATPLMNAAQEGHADVVKLLIQHGANVNARLDETRRLYGKAGFVGDKAAMRQIEQGGKLKTLHEDGSSVLDWAKFSRKPEVVELLVKAGAK